MIDILVLGGPTEVEAKQLIVLRRNAYKKTLKDHKMITWLPTSSGP
jgi:hypothetical protein